MNDRDRYRAGQLIAAAIKPTINPTVAEVRKMGSVSCYFHYIVIHAIAS